MQHQIVDIVSNGVHLSVERGFLKVAREKELLGRIALDLINALIVHGHGVSYSANLVSRLAERGTPIVMCGSNHAPVALVWPLDGHFEQGLRMEAQAAAGKPLRKRLWRDLVRAKIANQAHILDVFGVPNTRLIRLAKQIKSGDPENCEAQAAQYYWPRLMGPAFRRDRSGGEANTFLNYGYTILRAATARSIIAAGLHPSLAVYHKSRGTALRLADDLMEPFRPYVDLVVKNLVTGGLKVLDKEAKARLASIVTVDLESDYGTSPMQICLDRLAQSLARIYLGESKKLTIPGPPLRPIAGGSP